MTYISGSTGYLTSENELNLDLVKFSQKHQTSFFLTENRALRGGHRHDSIEFFFACIRRFRDSRGDKPLTLERVVAGSNALCSVPFFASLFFCDAAEPDCVVVLVIP